MEVPQLKVTCGTTDCPNGKHAFNDPGRVYKRRGQGRTHLEPGVCKACGFAGVDWQRVHARALSDVDYTFASLRLEYIRAHFWTAPFNERAVAYARTLGRERLVLEIGPQLDRTIVPAAMSAYSFKRVPVDQVKLRTPIQYAQHAVAACCRKCIATWHNIRHDRTPLRSQEAAYLDGLVRKYLEIRIERGDLL